MPSPKKRRPNISLISVRKSYEVWQLALLLDRSTYTIRTWIKEGLPILPGSKPRLLDGAEVKPWLQAKWSKRKKPCAIGELHCCKCRNPRAPGPKTVRTEPLSAKTTLIRGKCHVCGTAMQQIRKTETLAETIAVMTSLKQAPHRLPGYLDPRDNPPLRKGQRAFDLDPQDEGYKHVH